MEPRARAGRHKSTLNFPDELRKALIAFGNPTHPDLLPSTRHPDSKTYLDTLPTANTTHRPTPFHNTNNNDPEPFPETLRVLDELLTDFIIELCHEAVSHASYRGKHKLGLNDIFWTLRKDRKMMGRAREMLFKKKRIQDERRKVRQGVGADGAGGKLGLEDLEELGELAGLQRRKGVGRGKGKRGRRKKEGEGEENADDAEKEAEEGGTDDAEDDEGEKNGEGERPRKRQKTPKSGTAG